MIAIAKAIGIVIQNGSVTFHHSQSITLHSFKTTRAIPSNPKIVILLLLFVLSDIFICFKYELLAWDSNPLCLSLLKPCYHYTTQYASYYSTSSAACSPQLYLSTTILFNSDSNSGASVMLNGNSTVLPTSSLYRKLTNCLVGTGL
jgi:hypothetical protein